MKTQLEKNKEIILREIEKCGEKPMNNVVAEMLNVYNGAFEALCLLEKSGDKKSFLSETHAAEKHAHTPEMDGDTELERVFMQIPADKQHMMALFNVLSDHMDQLALAHHKMHKNLMMKFWEVARI